jgi:glycosyltransferase involved in cell wall biosynthesis
LKGKGIVKPLVSILIPAYNAELWIAETLRSALAQTWERKQIIVVNDGSTDGTIESVRQFEAAGVQLVTQENQGAAAARNKAFSVCTGDYIQWLDADDLLAPNKIARQMEVLEQCGNRTLASASWGRFLYRYNRAQFVPNALWADLSPTEWLIRKMGQDLFMQTGCWLVSREITEKAGPWDTRLLGDDDGEYFCRVLLAANEIRFVPEAKVFYRASGSSSLSYIGHSDKKMVAQWKSMELHIDYIRSLEDSERVNKACVNYLQNWLVFFYPSRPDLVRLAEEKARSLGGELRTPRLSWKYSWIEKLFGWKLAKRAQVLMPRIRWSLQTSWDRTMFRVERQSFADTAAGA